MWEAIRGVFAPEFKTAANKVAIARSLELLTCRCANADQVERSAIREISDDLSAQRSIKARRIVGAMDLRKLAIRRRRTQGSLVARSCPLPGPANCAAGSFLAGLRGMRFQ